MFKAKFLYMGQQNLNVSNVIEEYTAHQMILCTHKWFNY